MPNRFRAAGADGWIDGLDFSLLRNPSQIFQLTGVGGIVGTQVHRDTPAVDEAIEQLIGTKYGRDAANETAFAEYRAEEEITCRIEGLQQFHGRRCDHALFISGLFVSRL